MELQGRVAVVTGGGNGIGAALCRRFAAEGARAVVVADLDAGAAGAVAAEIDGYPTALDVSDQQAMRALVDDVEDAYGPIDLFCSNAGIGGTGGVEVDLETWQRVWDVNVMAHVHAARAVLPSMLARGEGYLLQTASAAGLLTNLGAAPYSVTKHAAVALAEWLAVTYGAQGVRVSCLCPQFVKTALLDDLATTDEVRAWAEGSAISPEEVAEAVVIGLQEESFLILPHPEVLEYFRRKAGDYDRWLAGMQRLQDQVLPGIPDPGA
jgi:NAD(P)-dependent dehydrogenase (short-subunit alcohol dehydrogenase family)